MDELLNRQWLGGMLLLLHRDRFLAGSRGLEERTRELGESLANHSADRGDRSSVGSGGSHIERVFR